MGPSTYAALKVQRAQTHKSCVGEFLSEPKLKVECPNCHSLFRVATESKTVIEDEKAQDIVDDRREKVEEFLEFLNPVSTVPMPGSKGQEMNVDDLTYEYRFRCKHCGYEWTEIKEKEKVEKI